MCLLVDSNYKNLELEDKGPFIRYKLLSFYEGKFYSPIFEEIWEKDKWVVAESDKKSWQHFYTDVFGSRKKHDHGFHVYPDIKDAKWSCLRDLKLGKLYITEVEVKGFIAGGVSAGYSNRTSESWKMARLKRVLFPHWDNELDTSTKTEII